METKEAKARHAERCREWRRKNRAHIREYNKRIWADIRDSYEKHDAHCERQAKARRRNGVTNPETMYTPHRGWRTPPLWMQRPCEYFIMLGSSPEGIAFAKELERERYSQLSLRNQI